MTRRRAHKNTSEAGSIIYSICSSASRSQAAHCYHSTICNLLKSFMLRKFCFGLFLRSQETNPTVKSMLFIPWQTDLLCDLGTPTVTTTSRPMCFWLKKSDWVTFRHWTIIPIQVILFKNNSSIVNSISFMKTPGL